MNEIKTIFQILQAAAVPFSKIIPKSEYCPIPLIIINLLYNYILLSVMQLNLKSRGKYNEGSG